MLVIRAIWILQGVVLATAVAGLAVLLRHRRYGEAALLALPLLYVTGVHVPLLSETRQSLPVKPMVLVAGRDRRHFPANRSFMNSSISATQTRPSAPF